MARLLRLLAAYVVLGVVLCPPAAAHPFGPPPTARVSVSGSTITIDWVATPDDAAAIGERLGVMPEGSVAAYRQESAAQVAPSGRDEARLSSSPELRAYLADRFTATQNGSSCSTEVPPPTDFVHEGARVELQCPEPVREATLRITVLHDIHDAYRTVATGTDTAPAQSVFTVAAPEHTWSFGVEPETERSLAEYMLRGTAIGLVTGLAGGAVIAAAFPLVQRLRRRW